MRSEVGRLRNEAGRCPSREDRKEERVNEPYTAEMLHGRRQARGTPRTTDKLEVLRQAPAKQLQT